MKHINRKNFAAVILGFFALCWFLIRVIPKPGRATYPCQRAAFPIASAFVIWLTGIFTSALFFVQFKKNIKKNKLAYAVLFAVLFGLAIVVHSFVNPASYSFAGNSDYQKAFWDGAERMASLESNLTSTFDEVGVVKSKQKDASAIDFEEIETLVRESVDLAGGLSGIVTNGDYVVLKPNLVSLPPAATSEYAEVSGVATDWRVVKAVAKMVRELNPDGKIYIIESSAASSTREILKFYNYTSENIPEVDEIVALEDSCGVFEDYADSHLVTMHLDDSVRLYPDAEKPNRSPEFYMNKIYNNADVVISIPVLKNHKEAIITGGIKNVAIGMTPPNIYGMSETFFGKWTKIDHSQENLHKWLHDFYLCRPVDFVVVDGLQGFDHGPVGSDELSMEEMQHNMGLIIAGKKALSVDAVCGNIMSLDPLYANYMVYLDKESYGVGTIDSRFIRLKGEHISSVRETFHHTSELTTSAVYSDYDPPEIKVASKNIEGNIVSFALEHDDDLNKVELKVNGFLLDQICIDHFTSVSFEVDEEFLPVENVKLMAYDRFFNLTELTLETVTVNEYELPSALLQQNFPNPFTSSTKIGFMLQKPGHIKLCVRDMNGRIIKMLVNSKLSSGNHEILMDGNLPVGTYLYTMEYDGKKLTKRMIKK